MCVVQFKLGVDIMLLQDIFFSTRFIRPFCKFANVKSPKESNNCTLVYRQLSWGISNEYKSSLSALNLNSTATFWYNNLHQAFS